MWECLLEPKSTVFYNISQEKRSITTEIKVNCASFVKINSTYKDEKNLDYPINVARNVARIQAATHFVLAAGLDDIFKIIILE